MILRALLLAALTVSAEAADTRPSPPGAALPVHRPIAHGQSFNDLVRSLVASREVQPLKDVLDAARKASTGEVVSIKLRKPKTRWIYHVRLLKPDGRRVDLDIDAKSLKILERK